MIYISIKIYQCLAENEIERCPSDSFRRLIHKQRQLMIDFDIRCTYLVSKISDDIFYLFSLVYLENSYIFTDTNQSLECVFDEKYKNIFDNSAQTSIYESNGNRNEIL